MCQSPGLRRLALRVRLIEGLGRTHAWPIGRMVDPVVDRHVGEQERIDAVQAADVVSVLVGERTALVVSVDAAVAAEVVLGHQTVELVQAQMLLALNESNARHRDRSDDRTLATTDRAVAAAWVDDSVGKLELEDDGAAVAAEAVPGKNGNAAD